MDIVAEIECPKALIPAISQIEALSPKNLRIRGCVIHIKSNAPWPGNADEWNLLRNLLDACWWKGIFPIFGLPHPPIHIPLMAGDLVPFIQPVSTQHRDPSYGHSAYFTQRYYHLKLMWSCGQRWRQEYHSSDLWFRLGKQGVWWSACDPKLLPLIQPRVTRSMTPVRHLRLGQDVLAEVSRLTSPWAGADPHRILKYVLSEALCKGLEDVFHLLPDQVRVVDMTHPHQDLVNSYGAGESLPSYHREVVLGSRIVHFNYELNHLRDFVSKHVQSLKFGHLSRIGQMIVHELNNPIGGIYNLTQLMQLSLNSESGEVRNVLKKIEQQCKRAKEIIEHLSSYFGATPAGKDSPWEELAVSGLFSEVKSLVCSALIGTELVADVNPPDLVIVTHRVKLLHVLVNLVINGAESIAGRGGIVHLRAYKTDRGVCVEVEDNGPGIPALLLDKIMTPFFSTKGKSGPNSGLGLSIVNFFLNELKYHLEVNSDTQKRVTVFRILIPK